MAHAKISPSAAHRWLHCSAAPSLEATQKDEGSVFAQEGTLAHAICEAKLHSLLGEIPEKYYFKENGAEWTSHELYQPAMEETSDFYLDVVANALQDAREVAPDAKLLIEQNVDLSEYIPEGFGTVDCCIVSDGLMNVVDYKHGKGVEVSAEWNPQMMIYALGAYEYFSDEYDITRVRMTIVQPRIHNLSTFEIEARLLIEWGKKVLKPSAEKAYLGFGGGSVEQKAGHWCKFCNCRSNCKALADLAVNTCQGDGRLLTLEEVAELLPKLATIKTWCTDVEEYALKAALEGEKVPGYKLVEGRSIRVVTDKDTLASRLQEVTDEPIFKPTELLSITNLEKLVGKKKFAELSEGLIVKPQGKPTLAPESDKRKELILNSAEEDFAHIINE